MQSFTPGEEVTVKGSVLRVRDGRVEMQLRDGQLLRVPAAHAVRAPEEKAVQQAPENKGVARAPESKGSGSKDNVRRGNDSGKRGA